MSKKLFKLTPLGLVAGALSGKKKGKSKIPETAATPKDGPIVTPLGSSAPSSLGDPRRRRITGSIPTILGGLNRTLGG